MTGKEAKERLRKQYERQNAYQKQAYDRTTVMLPKGTKDRIIKAGYKPGTLINSLVSAWLAEHETETESK